MSLEQIHTVLAVAETGSLRRAAERLHISQPPLTRRLASLEDELGTALFHRTSKGMRLSAAGTRFVAQAHRILNAIEDARKACADQDRAPEAPHAEGVSRPESTRLRASPVTDAGNPRRSGRRMALRT